VEQAAQKPLKREKGSSARLTVAIPTLIPALRETAAVLITYGYGRNFKQRLPGDQRLFEAFLGRPVQVHSDRIPGGWLWHDSADGRLVVYMDAPLAVSATPISTGSDRSFRGACPRAQPYPGKWLRYRSQKGSVRRTSRLPELGKSGLPLTVPMVDTPLEVAYRAGVRRSQRFSIRRSRTAPGSATQSSQSRSE
jgi:hypothetical protein